MLTDDVLELVVRLTETPTFRSGQRALITCKLESEIVKRAYSIVNYKNIEGGSEITFAIKILPDGKGSQFLKKLTIGDKLEINGIFWHFVLQETDAPKVLIGTGTGIAPLISIAETTNTQKILYFSVSYEKDLFYKDRIKAIPELESHIHVSRETVLGCEEGRIDLSTPKFLPESEFYLCGKPETVKLFKEILTQRWFTKIYTEMY